MMSHRSQPGRSGTTLLELMIAITLVSVLAIGMLFAVRAGLTALDSVNRRITSTRRVVGAERVLTSAFGNFLPVRAFCGQPGRPAEGEPDPFFQGDPASMHFVSGYSLAGAGRGYPQVMEMFVAPRPDGDGVRLMLNEFPYRGPISAGYFCSPPQPQAETGRLINRFRQPTLSPSSFVLADRLASCRFFFEEAAVDQPARWVPVWTRRDVWPRTIRIEIVPLQPDASRLQPQTVTASIRVTRLPGEPYVY